MDEVNIKLNDIRVGVVGLGLMGCSITTCLLLAGHVVVAIAPIPDDLLTADSRIREHLERSYKEELTLKEPKFHLANLTISEEYSLLARPFFISLTPN